MHRDGRAHGGTALIIRSSIKHYEIGKYQRDFLQVTSIVVEARNNSITISAVYPPLKHVIKIEQYITFLETLGNHFISGTITTSTRNASRE